MVGTITSSPALTSNNLREICKAEVPFIQPTTYLEFVYSDNASSNLSIKGPEVEIHPLSRHSSIYFFSFPTCWAMIIVSLYFHHILC